MFAAPVAGASLTFAERDRFFDGPGGEPEAASLGKPLFWIALAAGIVIASRMLVTRERFVIVALLIQFACYVGAYVASPYDIAWHVTYSWERLVAHLTPALTYVVLVSLIARRSD